MTMTMPKTIERAPATTTIETTKIASPVGDISLYARGDTLCALVFAGRHASIREDLAQRFGATRFVDAADPAGAVTALGRYFDGDLGALDRIPVDAGGTEFQARVWKALRDIPVGTTCSYAALARAVGKPEAVRAVGAANGRNPISLVIPCHRVIASDGTLCGYGGGLPRKRWLLVHERALLV
jgi:methylated-DNA-[protein]-cysteine S-methyltransferase